MLNSSSNRQAYLIELGVVEDSRGKLVIAEIQQQIPFELKRLFFVSGVPFGEVRGIHAHKNCHQFLICVSGSLKALVDDGNKQKVFELSENSIGLYMPPLSWGTQYEFSKDAVLLVLASDFYDEDDYIHDYLEFQKYMK